MNALASYLRHLVVVLVVMLVEKLGLPVEGLNEFAGEIATVAVATATWAVVKYVLPWLKTRGIVALLPVAISFSWMSVWVAVCFALAACVSTKMPDGTVERRPDAATVSQAFDLLKLLVPPPKAVPVVPLAPAK